MYYIIKESLDNIIIGTDYPQAYKYIKGYSPKDIHAIFELYEYVTEFPNFTPNLSGIMLSGRAKLTDFVSNPFGSIIISPKGKNVFEKFNLCSHRFYNMTLHVRKIPYEYYWMHIISDYSDFVDYKASSFIERNSYRALGSVFVESKDGMLQKRDEILHRNKGTTINLWADKIVMNSGFNKNLDLFEISLIDANLYVSERLKDEIIKNDLTGYEFIPANKLSLSN